MKVPVLATLSVFLAATVSCFVVPEIKHSSVELPPRPRPPMQPAPAEPAIDAASSPSSPYCNLTKAVTYEDRWGPLFTEKTYTCNFPETTDGRDFAGEPFRAPAPFSHPAGKTYGDVRVGSRGSLDYDDEVLHREYRAQLSKHQIHGYGCRSLPNAKHLSEERYSNLFWGLGQLWNQSCLPPQTMVEYMDVKQAWAADWRLTNVNRGDREICDWYTELSNIASALHYYCFHTLGMPENEERSGGFEILAHGRDGPQRWCVRYSKRGMDEKEFEEECLGIEAGDEEDEDWVSGEL